MQMTWFNHVGPEMKFLEEELKRQVSKQDGRNSSGYEHQVIWAINSLKKELGVFNNEVRNSYHPDYRKYNPVKTTIVEDFESGDAMRDDGPTGLFDEEF